MTDILRTHLLLPILVVISAFSSFFGTSAFADTYYIEPLQASPSIKIQQATRFEKILGTQAKLLLPGPVLKSRKQADTILKPILLETATGTQLVIERYDMGELLSVVEVPEIDFQPVDSWDRVCARAVREVIFGNFQRPSKALVASLSRLRIGHSVPIAAQ